MKEREQTRWNLSVFVTIFLEASWCTPYRPAVPEKATDVHNSVFRKSCKATKCISFLTL